MSKAKKLAISLLAISAVVLGLSLCCLALIVGSPQIAESSVGSSALLANTAATNLLALNIIYIVIPVVAVVVIVLAVVIFLLLRKKGQKKEAAPATEEAPEEEDVQPEIPDTVALAIPSLARDAVIQIVEEEEEAEEPPIMMLPPIDGEVLVDPEKPMVIVDENGELVEGLHSVDYKKNVAVVVKYNRSFEARIIQTDDKTKEWYDVLKNELMFYSGATSTLSWEYDCITVGKQVIAKLSIRGKSLCLYLPLNPADFEHSKCKVERAKQEIFVDTPCAYRIRTTTRAKYALDLIAILGSKYGLKKDTAQRKKKYTQAYVSTAELLEQGKIKEYMVRCKYDTFLKKMEKKK